MPKTLEPALNVPCPECGAGAGEWCISRHAVSIHQARRRALASLERQATAILMRDNKRKTRRRRA